MRDFDGYFIAYFTDGQLYAALAGNFFMWYLATVVPTIILWILCVKFAFLPWLQKHFNKSLPYVKTKDFRYSLYALAFEINLIPAVIMGLDPARIPERIFSFQIDLISPVIFIIVTIGLVTVFGGAGAAIGHAMTPASKMWEEDNE